MIFWGKYLTLTPAQWFKVGKETTEHGVTAAALICFDTEEETINHLDFQLPFALQFLSWSRVIPYELILMVTSNHRFYWKQQPSHIFYKQNVRANMCTYTQIRCRCFFNMRLIKLSSSIRQSLFHKKMMISLSFHQSLHPPKFPSIRYVYVMLKGLRNITTQTCCPLMWPEKLSKLMIEKIFNFKTGE